MKKLTLNETQYNEVMSYLQELPFRLSNNLIIQLEALFKEQNPEETKEPIIEE